MVPEQEQAERRARFVGTLLRGEGAVPPPGWYDVHGETGKSALLWSLARWRWEADRRATVYVPCAEPYDIGGAAKWAGLDPESLWILSHRENLLRLALNLARGGGVGTVIFEGLGFLLGRGALTEDVRALLGDPRDLFLLREAAEECDVALLATSYDTTDPFGGAGKNRPQGGLLLGSLCVDRLLRLSRTGFLLRGGRRVGEQLTVKNDTVGWDQSQRIEIRYAGGPVRFRRERERTP